MNIYVVTVPKNMTHLLHRLDLTTNASVKKMEKRGFILYGYLVFFAENKEQILLDVVVSNEISAKNIKFAS